MIADLIEGNLSAHPERASLLAGKLRRVVITANDLDAHVSLTLGGGEISIGAEPPTKPHMWIYADSSTLIELPNAKLMGGLPSVADPIGRAVTKKLLTGKMKIKGMFRVGLLSRVQRLLSVA